MNVVTTVIKSRRSVRKFKPDPVPDLVVTDALECGARAPTAMNAQPWLFGVIREKEQLAAIAALTQYGKFIADAPLAIAVFGRKNHPFYLEDCSAATENMILGLLAHGVSSCWVGGDKLPHAEGVRKLLAVPDEYTLVSIIAAGYPLEMAMTEKKLLKQIAFSGTWKKE